MMTRHEAEALYGAGKEAVVSVLLKMDARIEERTVWKNLHKSFVMSGRSSSTAALHEVKSSRQPISQRMN